MNERMYVFIALLSLFFMTITVVPSYYYLRHSRRRKSAYGDWEDLMNRLAMIDRDAVSLIARDFVDESGDRRTDEDENDLDPEKIWPLIGGLEGLKILQRNCAVLVDIVFYVQRWYPEALGVAEQLRLSAREIEWHIERLRGAEQSGRLRSSFPDYAQRVVAVYYLMTRRVLALYQHGNFPGLDDLQRAL